MKYTLRNYQKQAQRGAGREERAELGDSRYRLSSGRAAVSIST